MVTLLFTAMSPVMSVADKMAEKGDTKGIVRLNYLAMGALGLLFAVVCIAGLIGGSALGNTLDKLSQDFAWIMNGLGAAGGMMRFVGFATLLRIMLSNDLWGIYFARLCTCNNYRIHPGTGWFRSDPYRIRWYCNRTERLPDPRCN